MCIFTATTSHLFRGEQDPATLCRHRRSVGRRRRRRRRHRCNNFSSLGERTRCPRYPLRGNSRATNYLLGLSSHGLSNITAMLSRPTLPRTLPYDVSTRACICKVEPNARGLKKKKELQKKKNERKREKKALLVFKWRIVIVIRGVEHGVQRAS